MRARCCWGLLLLLAQGLTLAVAQTDAGAWSCEKSGLRVVVRPVDAVTFYVSYARTDSAEANACVSVAPGVEGQTYADVVREEAAGHVSWQTSGARLKLRTQDGALELRDAAGKVRLQTLRTPFDAEGRPEVAFRLEKDERLYGFGQKSTEVNRRGQAFDFFNRHRGGYTKPSAFMQINIPYVYSSEGWGLLFDTTWTGRADVGAAREEVFSFRLDGGGMAFYLTLAEGPEALLRRYFEWTGAAALPPLWAFGLVQSKCSYADQEEVLSVAARFRERAIPLSGLVLDLLWFGKMEGRHFPQMGNLDWYAPAWPEPEQMLAQLRALGLHTTLIIEPYFNVRSQHYEHLKRQGWLVASAGSTQPHVIDNYWAGASSLFDITRPEAQDWLWEQVERLFEQGIEGLWSDLCEPENPVFDGVFHAGPYRFVHNAYNLLWVQSLWERFEARYPNRRLMHLTRSGYAGIQRYGVMTWSGDASKTWDALALQVPMMLGTVLSGMPYFGSDVGGFNRVMDRAPDAGRDPEDTGQQTTPELYVRWFEHAVFSPMLRPHSAGQAVEPFAFDAETEALTVALIRLRYALIPYLYASAHRTWQEGSLFIRPLFFDYDDAEVLDVQDAYLFGRELLVAPVLERGVRERRVYLPQLPDGMAWVGWWDRQPHRSGREVVLSAPLGQIPVLVRQPAIFPLSQAASSDVKALFKSLSVEVYPGGAADFVLYEDDGESLAYREGAGLRTLLRTRREGEDVIIEALPEVGDWLPGFAERAWSLRVCLLASVEAVTLNGETCKTYVWDAEAGLLTLGWQGPVGAPWQVRLRGVRLLTP